MVDKPRENERALRRRVHDLRHTFGRRLRAAGVSFEDRQDLLGHKSSRMTTHYSLAELENLLRAVNSICDIYKTMSPLCPHRNTSSRKTPARQLAAKGSA